MLPESMNRFVSESMDLKGITKQIMPGPSGDLEEWQILEVNVTLGFALGETDLLGLPFLKVTLRPGIICILYHCKPIKFSNYKI